MKAKTAKKKSTIKIPRHRVTHSTPHYLYYDEQGCSNRIESFEDQIATGYRPETPRSDGYVRYKTEADWLADMERNIQDCNYEWKEPEEFTDAYQITGSYRGRSAAGFHMKSLTNGGTCCLMLSDLEDMILECDILHGKITGRWIFKKRGANYMIEYLGPMVEGEQLPVVMPE